MQTLPYQQYVFSDKDKQVYYLRKTNDEERELKERDVPTFPEDVRAKILQELREELVGRSSARNLLKLMTDQSPNKRRKLDDSSSEPINSQETETNPSADSQNPSSPDKNNKRPRETTSNPNFASGPPPLRKQNSSPSLTQANNAFAQGPWKREINELWAKQLAMMREINTLKTELARRESLRQSEILVMRQELDVMRAEFFRQRTGASVAKMQRAVSTKSLQPSPTGDPDKKTKV
eukprot:TRINITY_DN5271_c0_g1_i1.p2 TRINITY_DN5271_c0_g1~~TRINITY_DN5271_c0_g1_i1.p2  ORF type:complete len:236 (-),score=42.74 TRINITY_DN5271_c0_g1_i1:75-782(-)